MCSVEHLREFIQQRLTAAAEEIFTQFEKTIVQYEEEMDRQRRLLDISWKPQIKLHRTGGQQRCDVQDQVQTELQLCDQERNPSLDQEEPEPPQIKEEQEELHVGQEGQQLGLKEETEAFMIPPYKKMDNSEQESIGEQPHGPGAFRVVHTKPEEPLEDLSSPVHCEEEVELQRSLLDVTQKPEIKVYRTDYQQQQACKNKEQVPTEQQLCDQERNSILDQEDPEPPQIKEEQEELCVSQEGGRLGLKEEADAFMVTSAYKETDQSEPEPVSDQFLSPDAERRSEDSGSSRTAEQSFSHLYQHMNGHTGEKPYACKICEKCFSYISSLRKHMRTHTGEKPHHCKTCGKNFSQYDHLFRHVKTHTGEKPFTCETCGKSFCDNSRLSVHVRTHTGEKPFTCDTCGKSFIDKSRLSVHMRTHTGEKPCTCQTCGRTFSQSSTLSVHMRTHTGEKPHTCGTCGKSFSRRDNLSLHMRTHTGERPYSCRTCGKSFNHSSNLLVHTRIHTGEKL